GRDDGRQWSDHGDLEFHDGRAEDNQRHGEQRRKGRSVRGRDRNPADANHLTFTTQPQSVALGSAIAPPVVVTAWDPFDNVASGFTGDVLMALGHDASLLGNGTLSGTKTVAAVSGVTTFGDLSVDPLGIGYTLLASATGLTGAESSGFTVLSLVPC